MTHTQAVKAAVEAIGKWDGSAVDVLRLGWVTDERGLRMPVHEADGADGKPLDGYHLRQRLDQIQAAVAPDGAVTGIYWRGTNRRDEYAEVCAGKQIVSRNHRDGISEHGMSVSETAAYVVMAGFKFGYRVTGTVIGTGSDGEPILVNCQPVSKLMTANQVFARDTQHKSNRRWIEAVAAAIGKTPDQVLWLMRR